MILSYRHLYPTASPDRCSLVLVLQPMATNVVLIVTKTNLRQCSFSDMGQKVVQKARYTLFYKNLQAFLANIHHVCYFAYMHSVCKGVNNLPRNKYPEGTEQKILDAALKLFIEKGYEQTTILDIVGEMGGLTRGAFYHHFKSKEEVFFALTDKLFNDVKPFEKIKKRTNLNGLDKSKLVLQIINESEEYAELIEEGINDGSIKAKYLKLTAELFLLICNI